MNNIVIEMGRYKVVVLITLASIIISVLLTSLLLAVFADGLNVIAVFISVVVPMIIAPLVSWHIVGLVFNIHKLEQMQRSLATYDMLTGVMTRRAFLESSETLLQVMARDQSSMSLASIDLDNFKSINDLYGHAGGDEVLKSFTCLVKNNLRKSDLVGRIGGEEFAVVLPNTDTESSMHVLEKIRLSLATNTVHFSDKAIQYTVSIGVVRFDKANPVGLERLIQQSDVALYNAKKSGKNCIVEYQINHTDD